MRTLTHEDTSLGCGDIVAVGLGYGEYSDQLSRLFALNTKLQFQYPEVHLGHPPVNILFI